MGFSLLGVWALGGACLPIAECPTLIFYMHRELQIQDVREELREEMQQFMALHEIEHLVQVLRAKDEDLLDMEGFGMRLMVEVHRLRQLNLPSHG